ncbi:hypothetical protein OPV22_031512 [Ensete ventricosum]|uniref:Uncharacterized protein n=1 Tax=Ensete ventricosum TaxID=4639 RepID=A0AAV8P1A1_ENSVE|nr:hypothetical protein OPV22_031512 [Ensete ventricosum]
MRIKELEDGESEDSGGRRSLHSWVLYHLQTCPSSAAAWNSRSHTSNEPYGSWGQSPINSYRDYPFAPSLVDICQAIDFIDGCRREASPFTSKYSVCGQLIEVVGRKVMRSIIHHRHRDLKSPRKNDSTCQVLWSYALAQPLLQETKIHVRRRHRRATGRPPSEAQRGGWGDTCGNELDVGRTHMGCIRATFSWTTDNTNLCHLRSPQVTSDSMGSEPKGIGLRLEIASSGKGLDLCQRTGHMGRGSEDPPVYFVSQKGGSHGGFLLSFFFT